jgi:hypothetical protein
VRRRWRHSRTPVNDGEVRVFYGDGAGAFDVEPYYLGTALHNAGRLIADVGVDAASLATGDVDGDGDVDIIVGAIDGTNAVVKLLRNVDGAFTVDPPIVTVPAGANLSEPVYYPPTTTAIVSSPWGLALGDVDADGDLDLWVGDRGLYIYLYLNDGAGHYSLHVPASPPLATRPNVLLAHDAFRAALGYTPSLASADLNGDGKADLVMGLQSWNPTTTPPAEVAHDGEILLRKSTATDYVYSGATVVGDIGMIARGLAVLPVNADAYPDIIGAEFAGAVSLLRQLPPLDTDGDGISDYIDNAPGIANAPRLDMNTDASINYRDQLDNDFDTVLGDPEDTGTWVRLGDPFDPDDDNDGIADNVDNCVFTPNPDQSNVDGDQFGDACDPLDNRDADEDGVVTGPLPGDPLFEAAFAAKAKWSSGTTRFVIRIDALSRFFQNEFTQIMSDAAILSPEDWAAKCWENYEPGDFSPAYEPCGTGEGTPEQTLTLPGGKQVAVSLLVIPKQLWTDPPVLTWINDRNDYAELEIAQHGTYHADNVLKGDWAGLADRNFYACETCGLTEAENFELLRVGYNTLTGNYADKWVAESGATPSSPKVDWSTSANPLISYAPPYNTSDTTSRQASAQLGYKSFSASVYEEKSGTGYLGHIFSPEGSHMEQFDQFGMFHASADLQVDPPLMQGGVYNGIAYRMYLNSITQAGGLNTWLIEEVEWSGRPDNNAPRTEANRENNTVYLPRWEAWLDLLDFVKNYPDGVAMTLGDVALAMGFDNAPTVANPDQADSDRDGIGDVIDGAAITGAAVTLKSGRAGILEVSLKNGAGQAIPGQAVLFAFDADGDGSPEQYQATTNAAGVANVSVTVSGAAGDRSFTASWDSLRGFTALATVPVKVVVFTYLWLPVVLH